MRKFKVIFYPLYIITIILVVIISINVHDSIELFMKWGWFKYFSDLPFIGRNMMLFLCGMMAIELIVENVGVLFSRNRTKSVGRLQEGENI